MKTNIEGPENIVRAIQQHNLPVETVAGISTDKACKPVNTMGMTKAIQERIFIQANMRCGKTRFVCARYGNVLASRGSVIPLFLHQIRNGGPVTITSPQMTRFLLSLDEAVDTIFDAVQEGKPGETWIPKVPSALVTNIATVLIGQRPIETSIVGVRPGEKIHEILVSEEEAHRTEQRGQRYVIRPMLPEVAGERPAIPGLEKEYSSADCLMSLAETAKLLQQPGLVLEEPAEEVETLR